MKSSASILASGLEDMACILDAANEMWWCEKAEFALEIKDAQQRAKEVHGWFGGMGSVGDLYLCEANGHAVLSAEEDGLNETLQGIRSRLYEASSDVLEGSK